MQVISSRDPAIELQHALSSRLKMRQLTLLQAIDRHRTLSRVAAEMRLSQPAMTKALREVEDVFGSTLFERTRNGLVATPAGAAVLQYARRWLAELEATARVLTSLEAGRAGRLRVGLTQQLPQDLLSAVMTHVLDRMPRLSVLVREGTTDELVADLVARQIDCAIGRSYDGDAKELIQSVIYEQEPCLVVGAKHVKRLSRGPLDWAKLAQLDWILPLPNTPMRRTYNAIFVGAGVQPPLPILETASLRTIEMALRREPNGITIFARDVMASMRSGGVWDGLPYRLNWKLPPISFLTLKDLDADPAVRSLRESVISAAKRLAAAAA